MSKLSMFTKAVGEKKTYGFGSSVVATMMWVDDYGFPTEDEAVLDWYHNVWKKGETDDDGQTDDE